MYFIKYITFLQIIYITIITYECKRIKKVSNIEKGSSYWKSEGINDLKQRFFQNKNTKKAKNIILFIGDGMGISTIAATRIYKNQQNYDSKMPDEKLYFEKFPYTGLINTHSIDSYVSDSSSTATALLTGVKVQSGVVGVKPRIFKNDCTKYKVKYDDLETIGDMFYKQGRSVGVVTNTMITHATPACLYAHSPSRSWQARVPRSCSKVKDIAKQFVDKSHYYKVAYGGGLVNFLSKKHKRNGKRKDGKNLIEEWKRNLKGKRYKFINSTKELNGLNINEYDHVLGLFADWNMEFDMYKDPDEPSLEEMTTSAIKILNKDSNGFFLLVEGGRIDHAHHKSLAQIALKETLKFEEAIAAATKLVDLEETLILVTADHSHVFTIGSYEHRESDITQPNKGYHGRELDNKAHTSLLYSNGPGWKSPRENLTGETLQPEYVYPSAVPLQRETHGGDDVAVYGIGPWSHLVTGQHHQSYIGHLMMMASCTGSLKDYGLLLTHCYTKNFYLGSQEQIRVSYFCVSFYFVLFYVIFH